jgi:hypothetical protein
MNSATVVWLECPSGRVWMFPDDGVLKCNEGSRPTPTRRARMQYNGMPGFRGRLATDLHMQHPG